MAMGARFQSPLEREADGSLEVCGPVDFDPGDVMFEVISFSITDSKGATVTHLCVPPARATPGNMWESEIPKLQAQKLSPGAAKGQAFGLMHRQNGAVVPFHWAQPAPPLLIE